MKKFTTLAELATALNDVTDSSKFKPWEKGDKKRIYIHGAGYNTKKMETKVYIDLGGSYPTIQVRIECPSQPLSWISSQEAEIAAQYTSIVRYCARFFNFTTATQSIEVVLNNATLDAEPVKGYYTEWRNVRVSINRFGKLADRNRQFVVPFEGTMNTAPRTFIPCGPEGWEWLCKKGEFMLEPDSPLPDADERGRLQTKWEKEEQERKDNIAKQQESDNMAKNREAKELNEKRMALIAAGATDTEAWKAVGCPHPAPPSIAAKKIKSGLNWKDFMASI